MAPSISSFQSWCNGVLMLAVVVPPCFFVVWLQQQCGDAGQLVAKDVGSSLLPRMCDLYLSQPVVFVNIMYFVVVDVAFWIIYLLQGSAWLIDPHWQIIPVCITLLYYTHPSSTMTGVRSIAVLVLVLVWATRLMHNYCRREQWIFGGQEDWRYADMRKQHGRAWWFTSFFTVSVAQHPMLVGLTLPVHAAMLSSSSPLGVFDVIGCLCCVAGISIGCIADNQLFAYMNLASDKKPIVLDSGLWRYSRHPNHFGEQTWWIGLLLIGVGATGGSWWPICFGVLFNHTLDNLVTLHLIEGRMLRRPERVEAYKAYQARTSILVPMPPSRPDTSSTKTD